MASSSRATSRAPEPTRALPQKVEQGVLSPDGAEWRETGFGGPEVCRIVGITYRQLDYWARTDLLRPSLVDAQGSGTQRRYSYRDLVALKVIKSLLDGGLSLQTARKAIDYLRDHLGEDLASSSLVIEGASSVPGPDGRRHRRSRSQRAGCAEHRAARGSRRVAAGQHPRARTGGRTRRRRRRSARPADPLGPRDSWASGMTDPDPSLRHSPLDAEHRALGAKLVEFGGWEMPIQYAGVLEEHRACRTGAVVFDVSHLGTLRVAGPGAHPLLQRALTNDLDRIAPGRAQYTHLLDPDDAHIVDDIIVWWLAPDEFFVMPNASNTGRITGALADIVDATRPGAVEISDITGTRAVLAVQGPTARARLGTVDHALAAVERFGVAAVRWGDVECVIAGTGYTGEDGVEIHVPAPDAPALWRAIVAAGVVPAGLGARDTLRLEAGLPLHGHELGEGITPLQAGLGWVVRWDKGEFRGREPLAAERERGLTAGSEGCWSTGAARRGRTTRWWSTVWRWVR